MGKAGLKKDDVIVALDGEKIADYDAMIDFMAKKKPDDVVKFTVQARRQGNDPGREARSAPGTGGGGGGGGGDRWARAAVEAEAAEKAAAGKGRTLPRSSPASFPI